MRGKDLYHLWLSLYLCLFVYLCVCVHVCSVRSDCLRPLDCSPEGSSVHGSLQARTLEWVAMSSSRGPSQPRDWTRFSLIFHTGRQILYHWATREAPTAIPLSISDFIDITCAYVSVWSYIYIHIQVQAHVHIPIHFHVYTQNCK